MQQSYTDLESTANQLQETFHKILSPERINQLAKLTRLAVVLCHQYFQKQ